MKVALYSTSAENLFRYRLPVARRLAEAGYQILFISPNGPYADRLDETEFTCLRFDGASSRYTPFSELLSGFRLRTLYRQEEPDIVHHFGMDAIVHGGTAARAAKLPWVVHSVPSIDHDTARMSWLRPGARAVLRWAMREAEVTVQTPEDRLLLISKGCVRPERTHLIGDEVVDPEKITYVEEPARAPVAGFIGDLEPLPDVETFVETAKRVRSNVPNARFAILVADVDAEGTVRDKLEKWQEEGAVEWWPRRSIEASLRHVHVVCTPSCRHHRLRSLLLTAAAIGRPIVADEPHGCRDLVRHGVTGILVPARDVDALSGALEDLLSREERRREMGRNARSFIENEYAATFVAKQWMAVYQRLYEHGREV